MESWFDRVRVENNVSSRDHDTGSSPALGELAKLSLPVSWPQSEKVRHSDKGPALIKLKKKVGVVTKSGVTSKLSLHYH